MQLFNERPPNWEEIKKHFAIPENEEVYFSYGNCVYNPGSLDISADLIAHEETHLEQQGHTREGAAEWWRRFIADPLWRAEQEAEAYAAQYNFYCRREKDRNKRVRYLNAVAGQLASPLYATGLKTTDAAKMILSYAHGEHLKDIEKELN